MRKQEHKLTGDPDHDPLYRERIERYLAERKMDPQGWRHQKFGPA